MIGKFCNFCCFAQRGPFVYYYPYWDEERIYKLSFLRFWFLKYVLCSVFVNFLLLLQLIFIVLTFMQMSIVALKKDWKSICAIKCPDPPAELYDSCPFHSHILFLYILFLYACVK